MAQMTQIRTRNNFQFCLFRIRICVICEICGFFFFFFFFFFSPAYA